MKNISRPVRMYRRRLDGKRVPLSWRKIMPRRAGTAAAIAVVALLGGGIWWFGQPVAPGAKPAVAVLPFANYGGDDATGRLADGLTEDIITDLAQFPELDVVAPNSTQAYKGKSVDIREVARTLDVGYVLEGSIQRQGDRLRITAPRSRWTPRSAWLRGRLKS